MRIHAVHHLYDARLARSTRPFLARGGKVERCRFCMLRAHLCICALKSEVESDAAFMLVMYDDEVLKPSNTGRLIADLFRDTFAFIWSRTEPDPAMLDILADPQWQPYVIFPAEYGTPERVAAQISVGPGKRPLFILLDGSWSEAKKMFRKSPYLDGFPMLSITPDSRSRYRVREAAKENQLGTAEVAARIVDAYGESQNAEALDLWFDVFRESYLAGKLNRSLPEDSAVSRLRQTVSAEAV
ncbi:tRNA-uridine aminocarboxypropyltransferase [Photobacterium sp. 1_MG-2023]|uniref:tRNA-uridine aminocarboxypropyltransferase n=1 Tax=Photobacterium sp. 1_MG-2023 TaxID=3062646 RepID=UPI0026E2ED57|nr:tRNA-uridine aminocarboxypropyltransferase [Photobacterium sp. 1_MG-2023]MDO6705388.1 tRNA-uridine aminocarboxypropyltransferase [Photobacterium sp. 1_MG-2023]